MNFQTLYLIRHTRPDIPPGVCYGQLDIGLADSFDEEAANILNWLPPLDIIITSPLLRTRKLAEYLAQNSKQERSGQKVDSGYRATAPSFRNKSGSSPILGGNAAATLRVQTDTRLMEKHFGAWEGQAWDAIPRTEIDAWTADLMGYAPLGGESAQQLMQRVQPLWCDIAQLPVQNIALVAHGGSIRALLAQLAGVPLSDTLHWEIGFGAVIGVRTGRQRHAGASPCFDRP